MNWVVDEIVFGSDAINYQGWPFGIMKLITEAAESDSRKIELKEKECRRLESDTRRY
jgi:hypothetical protein